MSKFESLKDRGKEEILNKKLTFPIPDKCNVSERIQEPSMNDDLVGIEDPLNSRQFHYKSRCRPQKFRILYGQYNAMEKFTQNSRKDGHPLIVSVGN